VKEVLLSPSLYSSERIKDPQDMMTRDAPRHTQLRAIVSQAFTSCLPSPAIVRQITDELLDSRAEASHLDIVADLAIPLPVRVITEMLGVPKTDLPMMTSWSKTFVSAEGKQAEVSLAHYFTNLIAQKHMSPGNDITSALLQAHVRGELTMRELVTNCVLLFVAGNETTTNLIGNAMHCLEEHPEALSQLQENPTFIPDALEEVLRFRSPVQRTPRVAKADTIIANQEVKAGQYLYLWLGAANRDPEQFKSPNVFDIKRSPNHHLAFGHGVHFCMGATLARLEARIALECLLERFCEIQRDQSIALQPADTFFGLGLKEYQVTVKPKK
jgi:cytochrome P450